MSTNMKPPRKRLWRLITFILVGLIILILGACSALMLYEPSPAEVYSFSSAGETITLSDGRQLAYMDSGDPQGQSVFYLHGGPSSRLDAEIFEDLNQQLGIRMIAPDRPGFGLSDFQEERTYLDWPRDEKLADHLGIDRFAVLGWSSVDRMWL